MFVNNNQKKFNISFILLLYLSLIIGFLLNEDTLGAANIDYHGTTIQVLKAFQNNFLFTLFNYEVTGARHSPFFFITLYKLYYFIDNDLVFRLIFLHFNLLIPLFFYKSLKLKFNNFLNFKILLLPLIFLSPTFRSYSIWPDSFSFGLIFFSISTYYFLKFQKKKKFKDVILNIFFLALSSYFSPNFAIFSIYYFYNFSLYYIKDIKKILIIILTNFFLSSFAIYYIFFLDINIFQFGKNIYGYDESIFSILNISNKILLVSTIIFFHSFIFFINKFEARYLNRNNFVIFLISLIIVVFSFYFHDYSEVYEYIKGGGIFYKFLYELDLLYLILIPSTISVLFIFSLVKNNFYNLILIFVLFLSNPQLSIYHNYFEPLLYFCILFFIYEKNVQKFKIKNIFLINIFIIFYYFISLIKGSIIKVLI